MEAAKPATPADIRSIAGKRCKEQDRLRRGEARQRRPACDVLLCRADARGAVPPRRHRVAGVRPDRADRCRADPRQGRVHHRRCQPAAAGEGAGHPHSPQSAADALARKRGPRQRHGVDADLCRSRPGAAAAADGVAQHHRSRARQCQRAAGQSRRDAPADRSRRRRRVRRRHRAAADPRPHQAAGFRRTVAARIRARRGGSSEFRRCHRRGRRRQGDARPAGRIDAVVGRRRRRTRDRRGAAAVRRRRMAQEPRREIFPAAGRVDQGCFRRAGRREDAGPSRACQFLHGARDVSGGAGRHQPHPLRDQAG